ncbi:MAG: radical SAM family heme chaperone HemW [Flavobacteriales bacterium]|jgi:oxygen-independent coproporphyrinogen III oxidase|nr:radical SAM family heme chaperone HemW [Flavobacteriales bacterium]MBT6175188.1 radical SAM family heme chaperone HemW [Flavobacteriales bacterium]
MPGIYVHIPFCRTACHYCDFHFSTSLQRTGEFVNALLKEVGMRKESGVWDGSEFNTLYFGGGTPSVLSSKDLKRITDAIKTKFLPENLASFIEATIEVNPEDVTESALQGWLDAGFDRLSIGVQSFEDSKLKWMNRKHSADEAVKAVKLAHKMGFNKISLDLIYGLLQNDKEWGETVDKALSLPINHISCYALTVEPKTVLGHRVSKGVEKTTPDEKIEADYEYLCSAAKKAGFIHYEVSNWALGEEGRAVHNSAYWSGDPYVGLGPGAHGFRDNTRYAVISNNPRYISEVGRGLLPDSSEKLSRLDRCNESLMTGLRTDSGVSFIELERRWGINPAVVNAEAWKKWSDSGGLIKTGCKSGEYYRIPEKMWLIGDSISSDFFVT